MRVGILPWILNSWLSLVDSPRLCLPCAVHTVWSFISAFGNST